MKHSTQNYFRLFIVCLVLLLSQNIFVKAQMVYVPDANFRTKLTNLGFAACMTGDSIDSSCPNVASTTYLDISNGNISNIEGIQAFINLQTLYVTNDSLTSIPASIDSLHSLYYLDCSSNQLTSLPSLPDYLSTLVCNFNQLTSIPALPVNMYTLLCANNQLTSLPALNYPMLYLECPGNHLTSLPALPSCLVSLSCGANQLSSLPALSDSMDHLFCYDNQLTSLPTLPGKLTVMDCSYNQLLNLPSLPSVMTFLACHDNQLSILPVLPPGMIDLSCDYNNLVGLPAIPGSMVSLGCSRNQLTSLPLSLPSTLTFLACHSNQISSLPPLPPNLTDLQCGSNLLDTLPALPALLSILECSNNHLTFLPALPLSLNNLGCSANQLTSLPALPQSLRFLNCVLNQLTSLPALPDTMHDVYCGYNSNLNCLPELKQIVNLDFANTGITCLPNYGNVTNSNPPLASVPLCGLFNPGGCTFFSNMNGTSYFDSNSNCIIDSSDISQSNMHILLYESGNLIQQTFTGGEGKYSFNVNNAFGNYEVKLDTSNTPFTVLCPANNVYNDTITATDSIFYDNDFSLTCNGFDLGVQSIVANRFRPARLTSLQISAGDLSSFFNVHCAGGISGTVTTILEGPVTYISPDSHALVPDIITGDTLTYTIADFGAVDFFHAFNIIVRTDTFAVAGAQICVMVSAMPITNDHDSMNNVLSHCFTVVTSFDPNDKEVDPKDNIDIAGNRWLTYTIHFQNTGTAPAENIYLLDTLDQNLDLSTFQLLAYSHQPLVQILEGGIARFNFPNINLIDSNANEPASHGYVQYKIKMKNNLNSGMQIKNTAYIYFDFNAPVVTNRVVSNVTNVLGIHFQRVAESTIKIYPNPTRGEFTLAFSNHMGEKAIIKIFNMVGERVFEKAFIVSSTVKLNAELPKGIYVVDVDFGNSSEKKKLIVE